MSKERHKGLSRAMRRAARLGTSIELVDLSIAPTSPCDDVRFGPPAAKQMAERAAEQFTARFNAGVDCFALDNEQSAALRAITGQKGMPGEMLASCVALLIQLTFALINEWSRHWKVHRKEPSRQYMSFTFITDTGNTLARLGHVDLEALRRRADKILREAKLAAVFKIEVQLITNFPRHGHGGTHCWHVHGIATTDDPNCDIRALEAALRDSGRLSNIFGVPTVTLTPITSLGHLMRCCAYMLKPPAVGKRLVHHPRIPGAWTFKKVFVRKDEAVRLGEAISQITIGQLVHSVGDGKHILRPAMRNTRAWHKSQMRKVKNKLSTGFECAGLWADIRGSRANDRYQPYTFGHNGKAPNADSWTQLAAKVLATMNAARAGKRGEARQEPANHRSSANPLQHPESALDGL